MNNMNSLILSNENFTPTDLIEHMASVIYTKEVTSLRDRIEEWPEPLKMILLVIDFDTELAMNGILGFLENSSGKHLSETVTAFQLIHATEDSRILEEIKNWVEGIQFHAEIEVKPYQITAFEDRHSIDEAVLEKVEELADQLYLNSEDRNIFDYLLSYLSAGWGETLKQLEDMRK